MLGIFGLFSFLHVRLAFFSFSQNLFQQTSIYLFAFLFLYFDADLRHLRVTEMDNGKWDNGKKKTCVSGTTVKFRL